MNATLRRMLRQLTADRRKLSLMVCLLAVGMLLWGRLLLKQLPKSAVADPKARNTLKVSPVDKASHGKADSGPRTVSLDFSTDLDRDLFALDSRFFPIDEPVEPKLVMEPKLPADNTNALLAQVREKGRALQLQSVLMGTEPRALLNGQLLRVGDKIRGFELKEIKSRSVVLEMTGIQIEISM